MSMVTSAVIIGLISGAVGAEIMKRAGGRVAAIDIPNERSSHNAPTPRGGGIGIIAAFILTAVFVTGDFMSALAGAAIGGLGLLDDMFGLRAPVRLAVQFILAAVVFIPAGLPALGLNTVMILFWLVFIVGTANFYNFADGINGIAGLMGVCGFWLLAAFSLIVVKDAATGVLCFAIGAACLGFLPFNFPKAQVFMGDAGSVFLGFEFGYFTYRLSGSLSEFLCVSMFLCVFYADCLITLYYRWRSGEPLLKAHRIHLYQFLANELGQPHWKVSTAYFLAQALLGGLSVYAYTRGLEWQITLAAAFSISAVITYRLIKGISPRVYRLKKAEGV